MISIGIDRISVTISNGTSLSPEVPIGAKSLVGIAMPAVGWDAAALTFQVSIDDATFLNLQSGSAEVSLTAAAGQFIQVDNETWRGITGLKVRSGTAGAPVNQTADRVLTLVVRQNLT
jgi:hypothetical protein